MSHSKSTETKFTRKQRRFIDEYLIDLNATRAAIRAGYSAKTAYSIGQENLKKPEIKLKIDTELSELHNIQKKSLIIAADLAIKALKEIIEHGNGTARVQAANIILDRAGHRATDKIQINVDSTSKANLNIEDVRQRFFEKLNRAYAVKEGSNITETE